VKLPRLNRLELQVMESLWTQGSLSIREIQESFSASRRPPYTSVQTLVNRLEAKKAVRRAKKISNAHIYEAVVSRNVVQRRLVDDFLSLFGGQMQPIMTHLIDAGKFTLEDVQAAERELRKLARKESSS
jgi:BlaI family transcriptional regulator, penicillinase repressor